MRADFLKELPLPDLSDTTLAALAGKCKELTVRSQGIKDAVRHRFFDLAQAGRTPKLGNKLHHWWELDFTAFRTEIKRVFWVEIPVRERDNWERYLAENAAEVHALTEAIEASEQEIDTIVYRAFNLTADEIRLLEESLHEQL